MQLRAALALFVIALLAGCAGKPASYPESYILREDEVPAGLKLSQIPEGMPISGNPAEIPASMLGAMGDEFKQFAPDQVWVEFLENASSTSEFGADGGILLASGFWNDPQKISSAIETMKADAEEDLCAQDEPGALLQDGNVLVVIAGDESMRPWLDVLIERLQKDAPELKNVC